MNFKICEGALARILENIAIYDLTSNSPRKSAHECRQHFSEILSRSRVRAF